MKKTLDFYKEWHAMKKEVLEEDSKEKAAMTDADRRAHEEQCNAEFDQIYAKAMKEKAHTLCLRIPLRRRFFARLVRLAVDFAENSGTDITYEVTQEHGFLRLEMDQLILDEMRSEYLRLWRLMMRHADTLWVDNIEKYGDPAIQFTFFFPFQVKIRF